MGFFTRRVVVSLLGIAAYASLTGVAVTQSWRHYELIGIFLRYAVLLPAIVYGLRTPRAVAASLPHRRSTVLVCAFLAIAAAVSWRIGDGVTTTDESAYRFEALTLAAGEIVAPAPPGAPEGPADAPRPLRYPRHIVSRAGWYSMYPMGWPAVLAFPERIHLGWLVNPLLGALLLAITGLAAREACGPATVFPAVAMMALSPYVLGNSVGRMSHALTAVLVASASVLCIQGLKTGKLSRFGWMFLLLVATFHVRPLTAFVASVVLGLGALIGTRTRRALCVRVAALAATAAILAVATILLYNWRVTGHPLVSPFALSRGLIPREVVVTVPLLVRNLESVWRSSLQSTILYCFPFLALLAIYKFWASRPKSVVPWILAMLPCALALAYLVEPDGSFSISGERYWFEGYFGIVVLAAEGLTFLLSAWRSERRTVTAVAIGLMATQLAMMAAAATKLDRASLPRREMARLAGTYRNCGCVVYLADTPPAFYGEHMNLNGADWPSAGVFYAVDPGPDERAKWAGILHKGRWVVLKYDAQRSVAEVDGAGAL